MASVSAGLATRGYESSSVGIATRGYEASAGVHVPPTPVEIIETVTLVEAISVVSTRPPRAALEAKTEVVSALTMTLGTEPG